MPSEAISGNPWQSVTIRAPSHLRAVDAHTCQISLDEIGRVARARPAAVRQAIEIVRCEMMAAHRERRVGSRQQQRARDGGFVTERHPTALKFVTGLLRAHVPAQGHPARNQRAISAQSIDNQSAIQRQVERGGAFSQGGSGGEGGRGRRGWRGKGGKGRRGWGGGGGKGGEGEGGRGEGEGGGHAVTEKFGRRPSLATRLALHPPIGRDSSHVDRGRAMPRGWRGSGPVGKRGGAPW